MYHSIRESDTGLAQPSQWDLAGDQQMMKQEHALQVARCTKIIDAGTEDARYVIKIQEAKNRPNIEWQEKIHSATLRGLGNISETP
jgi:hypothetical protein